MKWLYERRYKKLLALAMKQGFTLVKTPDATHQSPIYIEVQNKLQCMIKIDSPTAEIMIHTESTGWIIGVLIHFFNKEFLSTKITGVFSTVAAHNVPPPPSRMPNKLRKLTIIKDPNNDSTRRT